ncbi:MAG: ATP-binding protein [Butyrivibrio sp.]|nr:ATP-binding protein [Butyrivibrio sp.]
MGLTNAQYDEIMREYERRRLNHRAEAQTRHTQIVRQIPEIAALEEERATISAAHARRLLSGEAVTGASLHEALTALSDRRATLLAQHGYPADYLDPIVDCPDCQDTGYVHGEKCHCLKQRIISCRYEQAGIQGLMSDVSFDRFSWDYCDGADLEYLKTARRAADLFIEDFRSGEKHPNLLLTGTVGTGKTFLSVCIARALLEEGAFVLYFSSVGLFQLLSENAYDYRKTDALREIHDDLYGCELLVIDDLGTEKLTPFVQTEFFACINERLLRERSTIITTNHSLDELNNLYTERCLSRITGNYKICRLTGPDVRLKKRMAARNA